MVATAIGVSLSLVRCISGPVGVMFGGMTQICTCIIDSSSRCGVAYAGADLASEGADLHIEDSTVIGKVWAHSMELASNTIFLARRPRHDPWDASLWCSTRQTGCVRFCFLPSDAIVPRQFECLPADPSQEDAFLPQFVTLEYGHPSYGLLSGDAPMAIWTGADNGSQIGVYNFIQETEAVRNVQLRAPEYLPFSLEAGIFLEPSRAAVIRPVHHVYGVGLRTDADCSSTASAWDSFLCASAVKPTMSVNMMTASLRSPSDNGDILRWGIYRLNPSLGKRRGNWRSPKPRLKGEVKSGPPP